MATRPVKSQRQSAHHLSVARSFRLFCLDTFRAEWSEGIGATEWIKDENIHVVHHSLNCPLFFERSTHSLPYYQPLHAPKCINCWSHDGQLGSYFHELIVLPTLTPHLACPEYPNSGTPQASLTGIAKGRDWVEINA